MDLERVVLTQVHHKHQSEWWMCTNIFFTYSNPLFFALLSTCPLTQFYYLQVKLQVLQEEEEEEEEEEEKKDEEEEGKR